MAAPESGGPAPPLTPRVLIVDTDAQSVRQLVLELRRSGYEPLEATSFEDGKKLWAAEHPPMMIVDVRLGQFNGLQLLLRARAERPNLKAIVTCSFPDKVLEAETTRFGGVFLVKPLSAAQVMTILGSLDTERQPAGEQAAFVERRSRQRRQLVAPNFSPERRVSDRRHGNYTQH